VHSSLVRKEPVGFLRSSVRGVNGSAALELLTTLISIPSESGHEAAILEFLEKPLSLNGVQIRHQRVGTQRHNLVATFGHGTDYHVLFNTHVDTVPSYGRAVAEAKVTQRRIWGRGACDAKGSLSAMCTAFLHLVRMRSIRNGKVTLALTVGEEFAGDGIARFVRAGKPYDCVIVGEPTDLTIAHSQAGYVEVNLAVTSDRSHAFAPRSSQPIMVAAECLTALNTAVTDITAGVGRLFVRRVEGGSHDNFWYIRPGCEIRALANAPSNKQIDRLRAELSRVISGTLPSFKGVRIVFRIVEWDYGIDAASATRAAQMLAAGLELAGVAPTFTHLPSWTDGSTLAQAGHSVVTFGPGRLNDAHSSNESVRTGHVVAAAKALVGTVLMMEARHRYALRRQARE